MSLSSNQVGGARLLQAVKSFQHANDFHLPVGEYRLRPIETRSGQLVSEQVRSLTQWRNRFVTAFLHEFEATEQRTSRWLEAVVGPDDTRILFALEDASGSMCGYLGLAYIDWAHRYGEADAIVRGVDLPKGVMAMALRTLLDWASRALELGELGVRVLSDNPACAFYRKVGFVEIAREPLRAIKTDDGQHWQVDASLPAGSGRELIHFRYARS